MYTTRSIAAFSLEDSLKEEIKFRRKVFLFRALISRLNFLSKLEVSSSFFIRRVFWWIGIEIQLRFNLILGNSSLLCNQNDTEVCFGNWSVNERLISKPLESIPKSINKVFTISERFSVICSGNIALGRELLEFASNINAKSLIQLKYYSRNFVNVSNSLPRFLESQ